MLSELIFGVEGGKRIFVAEVVTCGWMSLWTPGVIKVKDKLLVFINKHVTSRLGVMYSERSFVRTSTGEMLRECL